MYMDNTAPPPKAGPQKEQEPIVAPASPGYLERVERQPEIPPEVARVGVAPVSPPTITSEDREAGLEEAKEEIPVTTTPQGLIKLPLTEDEAKKTLTIHKNIADAIVWLANFVLRQFKIVKMRRGGKYVG